MVAIALVETEVIARPRSADTVRMPAEDVATLRHLWRSLEGELGLRSLHQAMIDGIAGAHGTGSVHYELPVERYCFKDAATREPITRAYRTLVALADTDGGGAHARVLYRVYGPRVANARDDVFGEAAGLIEYTSSVVALAEARQAQEVRAAQRSVRVFWQKESEDAPLRAARIQSELEDLEMRCAAARDGIAAARGDRARMPEAKNALLRAERERNYVRRQAVQLALLYQGHESTQARRLARPVGAAPLDTAGVLRRALGAGILRGSRESDGDFHRRRHMAELRRSAFIDQAKKEAHALLSAASAAYLAARADG